MPLLNMDVFVKLLSTIINMASPGMKECVKNFISELEKKAKGSANPVDDLLIELFKVILSS